MPECIPTEVEVFSRELYVWFEMNTSSTAVPYRCLLFASNGIGPAGAEGVAGALAKSPTLRELHFSGNALEGIGVATLVKGAVQGRSLRGDPGRVDRLHAVCCESDAFSLRCIPQTITLATISCEV